MTRSRVLAYLRQHDGPVSVPALRARFGATHEDVYAKLVQLEAKRLARPVIGEISPGRWKSTGWVMAA